MNEGEVSGAERALDAQFQLHLLAARREIQVPWSTRRNRLLRLRALLTENQVGLAAAISSDFGNRPIQETQLLELLPTLEGIRHALHAGRRWMHVERRATSRWFRPGRSILVPQPLGVVGIVAPWNYPILLVAGPMTAALAAGNRVMVKLSEYTPAFGKLLADLVQKYFAADEVWVVNGDASVAEAFCALPFDHLLFTGSTPVGRLVMRSASAHLTPVTLELGGKSPAIIGPGADFGAAVTRIMAGKLVNAGQTCIAPDYVMLPESALPQFIEAARAAVHAAYPGLDQAGAAPHDYTTIVTSGHMARLQLLVEDAVAAGAVAVRLTQGSSDPVRRIFHPLLLTGVSSASRVMREEIFGPILPVVPYRSIEEALAFINARPRPLALYLFERDARLIDQVLAGTVSGGVTVNDTLLHIAQDDLPFGGVGASGMGAYHGRQGFMTFSHMKPVFQQTRLNVMGWFSPPYGRRFDWLMRLLVR